MLCAPASGNVIRRDSSRLLDVGDIDDVNDALHGNAIATRQIERAREDLVAHEHIILVAEHRVRAGQPAGPIQLVIVETKLADKLRVLRAAALDAVADVEHDQTVAPVPAYSRPSFTCTSCR